MAQQRTPKITPNASDVDATILTVGTLSAVNTDKINFPSKLFNIPNNKAANLN